MQKIVWAAQKIQAKLSDVTDCLQMNEARYMITQVACGWAGAVMRKADKAIRQEQ